MAGGGQAHLRAPGEALLRLEDLVVHHRDGRGRTVHAVSGVSLDVLPGETLGLVGESGCGKSSTARAALMLPPPSSGRVSVEGHDLSRMRPQELRRLRPRLQMIFQDPVGALSPRRRVRDIVAEGLSITKARRPWDARVDEAMASVGLDPALIGGRRPSELSGGQCQRVAIARALVLEPALLVCDEPVSALDVSVQAQILNLLEDMKVRNALSMLFIAHDLAVVKNISDRVVVMYLGKLCEVASADDIYTAPRHPYTQALLHAVPDLDLDLEPGPESERPGVELLGVELPSPIAPPTGCRFRTRCPLAAEVCTREEPMMRQVGPGHYVACHAVAQVLEAPPGPVGGADSAVKEGRT